MNAKSIRLRSLGTLCAPALSLMFSVVSPAEGTGRPGEVIQADSKGVLVACQSGALRLEEVRPSGKKLMTATAWAAGRGIQKGDLFNPPS